MTATPEETTEQREARQEATEELRTALGQPPGRSRVELLGLVESLVFEKPDSPAAPPTHQLLGSCEIDVSTSTFAPGYGAGYASAVRGDGERLSSGDDDPAFARDWNAGFDDAIADMAQADSDAELRPANPTHQDVVDAVRARIIEDCDDRGEVQDGPGAGTAELAALVTAYNGTDARESVDIRERVSAALGRPEWDKDVNTAAEMAQVVALALVGGRS